jgi:23S rRNA pseudouridine1911/1915/1917 synthase
MTNSFQFRIEQPDARQRLDEFLASRFGGLSRMRIANLIEAGACRVNGEGSRGGYRVVPGDAVEISFQDGPPTAMSAEPIVLETIHEDEHLILVVKPSGMLVHPTMSVKTGTLANALAYHLNRSFYNGSGFRVQSSGLPLGRAHQQNEANSELETRNSEPTGHEQRHLFVRPGIVHRLDRATSGLMVIAKTPRALAALSRHFRKRLVEKRYLALVHGTVQEDSGSIDGPIGRDPDRLPRWGVMEGGKPAETRFRVLERLGVVTYLELQPVTGRTNQLRIHCAHIGHPIVGDEMHGYCGFRPGQFATRHSPFEIPLCLHASKLSFHHPATGEWMEFSSPIPPGITAVIEALRASPSV